METNRLALLVRQMREAQQRYFTHRTQTNLLTAKALEKKVDQAVEAVLHPAPASLFASQQGNLP